MRLRYLVATSVAIFFAVHSARAQEFALHETLATTSFGRGTPVVIVPGILGSEYSFRKVIPTLVADNFHVTVIEPLGYGGSPRPDKADYSYTAQANRLASSIEQQGLHKVILVCHTVAGSICYRMALHHPGLVRGIVSINGGPSEQPGTTQTKYALKFARLVLSIMGKDYAFKKVKQGMADSAGDPSWVTDSIVKEYVKPFGPDVRSVVKSLQQIVNAKEPERIVPNLAKIDAPVILLYGTGPRGKNKPPLPAAERAQLKAGLKSYVEEEIPNTGQLIQEEAPAQVIEAILRMRDKTK